MDILSIGDQDYISGKPIDFKVVTPYTNRYNDGRDSAETYEGVLYYEKEVVKKDWRGNVIQRIPPKWFIQVDRGRYYLDPEKLLNTDWSNRDSDKTNIQLLDSRELTDRTRPIKEEKDRKMAEFEESRRILAEKMRNDAAEQNRIFQQEKDRQTAERVRVILEKDKIEKAKAAEQKKIEDDEDKQLEQNIKTGIVTKHTIIGDRVIYNQKNATVKEPYFLIQYDDGTTDIVATNQLMNIDAAKRKKADVLESRQIALKKSYEYSNIWDRSGGTRRKRKRNKTRK